MPALTLRVLLLLCLAAGGSAVTVATAGTATAGTRTGPAVPAFPGALGFGAGATGGRGGEILRVTTLAGDGPGSLREALEEHGGPRIVVFEVGGTIVLDREIRVNGRVTLAGQTAPGDGVTVTGARLLVVGDDVVIRGMRLRPGDAPDPGFDWRDGISVGVEGRTVRRVIVDRNSIGWAPDENAATWNPVEGVTFSNNIIAEALSVPERGLASMGLLVGAEARRVTVARNLFAHNAHRNPQARLAREVEVANNLIHNWGPTGIVADGAGTTAHIVGNVFLPGPDSVPRPPVRMNEADDRTAVFLSDNRGPTRPAGDLPEAAIAGGEALSILSDRPVFAPSGLDILPAGQVRAHVLASAGARVPRTDPTDARVLASVLGGTGRIITSPSEVGDAPPRDVRTGHADCDGDGMPDAIERLLGADPSRFDAHDDPDGDGYGHLETYLDGLFHGIALPDRSVPLEPDDRLPLRLEAETFGRLDGFGATANGNASGGAQIEAQRPGPVRAATRFEGPAGAYILSVAHFDEADGQSSLSVTVDGVPVGAWTWDADPGGDVADAAALTDRRVGRIDLQPGSCIAIEGRSDGGEPLRIDALDLLPTIPDPCRAARAAASPGGGC